MTTAPPAAETDVTEADASASDAPTVGAAVAEALAGTLAGAGEVEDRPPAPQAAERRERGREAALRLAGICAEFRGRDTAVLDLTAVTPVFDYFVLTTGTSRRQMVALAEEADVRMKHAGDRKRGGEGDESGTWILRDYGDVVLHVLTEESRDLYDLEGLWGDADRVDWRTPLGIPREEKPASPSPPGDAPETDDASDLPDAA